MEKYNQKRLKKECINWRSLSRRVRLDFDVQLGKNLGQIELIGCEALAFVSMSFMNNIRL